MQVTTWFLARVDEAAAIASIITTEAHSYDDWPHLELPLITLELMALSAALRGTVTEAESTLETPLVWQEADGLLVARVKDSFIRALARVTVEREPAVADAWAAKIDRLHHEPPQLREFLSDISHFAREAVERRSPVLELSTL
jgi:hypothetical protein